MHGGSRLLRVSGLVIGLVRGRRIEGLTIQTGVEERGASDIEHVSGNDARTAGVTLVTLFSADVGIHGTEDRENLGRGNHARSGLIVHSLYTSTAIVPPDRTLRGVDVIVVDLQDIGTRTWTYVGSVVYAMRAAARNRRRECRFAETALPWVRRSPNLPSLCAPFTICPVSRFETSNLSVARGTRTPFGGSRSAKRSRSRNGCGRWRRIATTSNVHEPS